MWNREKLEHVRSRSARIALMAIMAREGKPLDSAELAKICGVTRRSIQRDLHEVIAVMQKLAELEQPDGVGHLLTFSPK